MLQGNLFDYLDWRADVPFEADPFGEVDNLLMALISYIDFEDVLTRIHPQERMGIDEAAGLYFSMHTEEELRARPTYTRLVPLVLQKMAGSRRYGDLKLFGYVNIFSADRAEQMAAVAIEVGDGSVYASFRGTDGTVTGWKEDFKISYSRDSEGHKHAARWLSMHMAGEERVRVGGHSKGGNFAVYAASFCDPQVQSHITDVYSNDGPGFLKEIIETEEYTRILPRIQSYVPEDSFFGQMMYSLCRDQVVKSSVKGVIQHDALTWQIMRNRFVRSEEISETSVFTDRMITEWMEGFSPEEREAFISSVFELVESTGAESIPELNANRFKNYLEIFRNYRSLDEEQQEMLKTIGGALLHSATSNARAQLPSASELLDSLRHSAAKKIDHLGDVMLRAADNLLGNENDEEAGKKAADENGTKMIEPVESGSEETAPDHGSRQ